MAPHVLRPTPGAVADVFSRDAQPVLTIAPGDEVHVETLDAWGFLAPQRYAGEERPMLFPARRGHCLAGPIAVEGARPGDFLAVHLSRVRPSTWGWTTAGAHDTPLNRRLGIERTRWLLWDIDADTGTGRCDLGYEVELAPFLGVVGVAPEEPGPHSTIPPRACGGNLDCRELVAGSTLVLPVMVEGALLYVGDGHAAQGDGEVSGTAIECAMESDLVVDLVPAPTLRTLHATTPAGRVTFGVHPDLNEAMAMALDAMVSWMANVLGCSRSEATALASVGVDLRVTQVVNRTWGVHALWPDGRLHSAQPRPPAVKA